MRLFWTGIQRLSRYPPSRPCPNHQPPLVLILVLVFVLVLVLVLLDHYSNLLALASIHLTLHVLRIYSNIIVVARVI